MSNGNTFDGPSTTGGLPFGFPQVRAVVLAETGTHGVLDARLGGYRDGERRLAYQLADSTSSGDLVIADRGFWSVEFAHVFTVTGVDLLVRLQSNHLGALQEELPDGSYLSMSRPGKEVRLRAGREGRTLPSHTIYRVITFTKDDKVAFLGTTLLDPEQYRRPNWSRSTGNAGRSSWPSTRSRTTSAPAARSGCARRKESGRICGPTSPLTTRSAGSPTPPLSPAPPWTRTGSPCLKCVRIIRRSVPSQLGANTAKLTRSLTEAGQEARSRLLAARRNRKCPRAIKKPNRWPVLRTRAKRDAVKPGRWALNQTTKAKTNRRAGRPMLRETRGLPPEAVPPAP